MHTDSEATQIRSCTVGSYGWKGNAEFRAGISQILEVAVKIQTPDTSSYLLDLGTVWPFER